MRANTIIGAPVISREVTDTFSGYLFAYDSAYDSSSTVSNWSFYAGSANGGSVVGHELTPVIMDQSDPDNWVITGVGTSRTVLSSRLQFVWFRPGHWYQLRRTASDIRLVRRLCDFAKPGNHLVRSRHTDYRRARFYRPPVSYTRHGISD